MTATTFLRFTLHVAAVLAGAYSLLTWVMGLLTDAGISGAISALCIVAAEGIWWCSKDRERMRQGREEVWRRRIDTPLPDTNTFAKCEGSAGRWTVPDDYWPQERPVWPIDAGSFE
jgi:hypothetical protein